MGNSRSRSHNYSYLSKQTLSTMPAFFRMNLDRTSDFTNPPGYLLGGLFFLPKTTALFTGLATRKWDVLCRALRPFRSGCSNYRFFNARLRKLIRSRTDECMAETGEFILTVQCHAPLVTFRNGELPDR